MASPGQTNIANARTTYETLVQNALLADREQGVWQRLAQRRTGTGSTAVQIIVPGATPNYEQWHGEKTSKGARKLTKTIYFDKYHKTLELDRPDVVHDLDGSTGEQIAYHVRDVGYVFDKVVIESLAGNPTGADGVSLLNDSHPYSGTDNKTTDALNFDSWDAAVSAMATFTDEYSEPLGIRPDILLVHPDERRIALEIAQADARPVSVGTGGEITINGSGLGATSMTNVYKGAMTVIESARWTSGKWLAVDSRFPPMGLVVWRDPETHILDRMEDLPRFMKDKLLYSVEADCAADGVQHLGCYGNL